MIEMMIEVVEIEVEDEMALEEIEIEMIELRETEMILAQEDKEVLHHQLNQIQISHQELKEVEEEINLLLYNH